MGGCSPPPAPAAPTTAPGSGAANYIPNNQSGIDASFNNLFSSLQSGAQGVTNFGIPAIYNYASNIENNPYASSAIQGAVTGSNYALNTQIPALQSAATGLTGSASQALPYENKILQQGFDPQSSLYNRSVQQLTDQYGAANAMSGVSGPAAAGVIDQGLNNFAIDWQNNQLGRESTAASGYSNLASGVAGNYQAGLGYLGQVPGTETGATAVPYSTYNNLQQQPINAIGATANTVSSLYNPTTAALGTALNYLGTGTAASGQFNNAANANYNSQITGYNAQQQAQAQLYSGIGNLGGGAFDAASNPLSLFGTSLW